MPRWSAMFENNTHDVSNVYKYLEAINKGGKFWSIQKLLTYNKPFMVITSSRSIGKSTNIAAFCIFDYLENGKKFIYLRRTKDEMQETCRDYFSNAIALINENTKFQIEEIEYKAGDYFIKMEGEETARHCGYAMGLSLQDKYKSKPFDDVGTIVYDEFLPQDKNKYLGSIEKDPDKEPRLFNSLYGSVDREIGKAFKSSTRVILSGNTETIYNPFFISWGVAPYIFKDEKAKIINPKDKPWVFQRVTQVDATKDFEDTLLYAMSNERDKRYNFQNNGADDFSQEWIEKPPRGCTHMAFIKLDKVTYQILRKNMEFYIIRYTGNVYDRVITLDFSSFASQDFALVKRWRNNIELMLTHEAFLRGSLYFDSPDTRRIFTNYFDLI